MPGPAEGALRIAGVGDQTTGFERLLIEIWGFSPVRDGDDWVILSTDSGLRTAPRDVLRMHGPLPLKYTNRHKVAGRMISWIPGTVNKLIDQLGDTADCSFEEDSVLNLPLMIEMGATNLYWCDCRRAISRADLYLLEIWPAYEGIHL